MRTKSEEEGPRKQLSKTSIMFRGLFMDCEWGQVHADFQVLKLQGAANASYVQIN